MIPTKHSELNIMPDCFIYNYPIFQIEIQTRMQSSLEVSCHKCRNASSELSLYTACQKFLCMSCTIHMLEVQNDTGVVYCCGLETIIEKDSMRSLMRRKRNL